jgi:hypothetical protein
MMMEAKVTSGSEGDRCAFLPSEAGEVSASYADGGVMSTRADAHDPSALV